MLMLSRMGAPRSRAAKEEAVNSLKENLEVDALPTLEADTETIEKVKDKHEKEIKELKEAHDEALKKPTDEKDEELQALKDEAKLAQLKLLAMQERLDAGMRPDRSAMTRSRAAAKWAWQ
eukprot:3415835-Pleurochrysis_carterae.AAC.1